MFLQFKGLGVVEIVFVLCLLKEQEESFTIIFVFQIVVWASGLVMMIIDSDSPEKNLGGSYKSQADKYGDNMYLLTKKGKPII